MLTPPTAPTGTTPIQPNAFGKDTAEVRRLAEQWVGQTFFGNLLKQARESPFKSELMGGGRGGEAFGGMLDMELAMRASRGFGGKLVDSLVKSITGETGRSTGSMIDRQA